MSTNPSSQLGAVDEYAYSPQSNAEGGDHTTLGSTSGLGIDDVIPDLLLDRPSEQTAMPEIVPEDDREPHGNSSSSSLTVSLSSPLSDVAELEMESVHEWSGFKVIGDNIDKNVRPSFQRLDHRTQSLHYFHSIAVRDRADHSSASISVPTGLPIDRKKFFLSDSDVLSLERDFETLLSRLGMFSYAMSEYKLGFNCLLLLECDPLSVF